jgi:hypothetical protein
MIDGVFKSVKKRPIPTRIESKELVPVCPGTARKADASCINTTCTKIEKTDVMYVFAEISA